MTFQPIILAKGFAGWAALKRSMPQQQEIFNSDPVNAREVGYFKDNITKVKTADDLVSDSRLLRVALSAFGLQEDIGSKFFIKKVLSEGTVEPDALANKLSDKRYAAIAQAFGFDMPTGPNTQKTSFADDVVRRYQSKSFEVAVGNKDPDMRLAMGVPRGLADATEGTSSNNAHWFRAMGTPSLRKVIELSLGLPASMGKLPIDSQLVQFKSRAKAVLGTDSLAVIEADPDLQDKLTRGFLLRSQMESFSLRTQKAESALMMLSQIRFADNSLY